MTLPEFSTAFGVTFEQLHSRTGLEHVDRCFLEFLGASDGALHARVRAARSDPSQCIGGQRTDLLMAVAPHVEDFLAILFRVESELAGLRAQHDALAPLYAVKRNFVQRRAAKLLSVEAAAALESPQLCAQLGLGARAGTRDFELQFAAAIQSWEQDADAHAQQIAVALEYAAWALHSPNGRRLHEDGILFQVPLRLDPLKLVDVRVVVETDPPALERPGKAAQQRDGFGLTDPGTDLAGALDEAHYCIHCHAQSRDSCAKGLRNHPDGSFRQSQLGTSLTGCPLEERISEFLELKAAGRPVAALAMVMIDNPLVAATGHRICNDCMKSCIYQKQTPVDIPQAETRTLKDVLELPWGFELYSLLSRWNPLNLERPLPRPVSGYKVLVVGMGPAGFALAHHLLNDGHAVVGIDGLKIEPLAAQLSGVQIDGSRVPFEPVHDVSKLRSALDERVMAGFGGVAEYGITARWDKNFLLLVRLLLERRADFSLIGGVRFGGALSFEDAFAAGFDHVALCMGAGRPTLLPLQDGLARGIRQATDFLMALQLTGAARPTSIANLQVRLPVIVIGGGLTALDAATEALAYYPVQVERFLSRYETLAATVGEESARAGWTAEDIAIAEEFLCHGRAIREERQRALAEGRSPDLRRLLLAWGGSTIAYRRALTEAPCYRLNHEEVSHALDEGVRFLEHVTPESIETDAAGHLNALILKQHDGGEVRVLARTLLIAAGSHPNTVLSREEPSYLALDGRHFTTIREDGIRIPPELTAKPTEAQVLTHRAADGRFVSFFGDLHPTFSGNVVKAMASAKLGVPAVSRCLASRAPTQVSFATLVAQLNRDLRAVVRRVRSLTPTITEVLVHAPQAARRFQPGQFFRLQNFESLAPRKADTVLALEGLALTGAWVDAEAGLVALIVLKTGGSADLCDLLRPGEPVVLMGPTGEPTQLPVDATVCLVGGGLGNAVLFSIGQAARARGNRVIYFAAYRSHLDRFEQQQIERAADIVVWSCEQEPGFTPGRPGDFAVMGNVIDAMHAYASGGLGPVQLSLHEVDHLIAIGSDRMMRAVAEARRGRLAPFLRQGHVAIGSINSPMQCMMKEICAQCLQLQRDPITGATRTVFSCAGQDQPLDTVDFDVLRARLGQNAMSEKLSAAWIRHCIASSELT